MDYGGLPILPTAYCAADSICDPPPGWEGTRGIDVSCLFDDWVTDALWSRRARGRLLTFAKRLAASHDFTMQVGTVSSAGPAGRSGIDLRYRQCLYDSRIVLQANPDSWEGDARTWEALASGALVFVDRMQAPIENPLVDGEPLVFYDLTDDGMTRLEQQVVHFLGDDRERQRIATQGTEFVLGHHRSIHRVEAIVRELERTEALRRPVRRAAPDIDDTAASRPAAAGAPYRARRQAADMKPRIFVAIASYADPELPRTLEDCSAMARWPERLRFGICWQQDPDQPIDVARFRADARFRFVDRTVRESQGGPWARNLAQSLWRGEPYTLQVDSHMKFEPDWDARLAEMLEALPAAKPIITMNAPLFYYDDDGRLQRRFDMGVPTTKVSGWDERGGWAPWFDFGAPNRQHPGRTRFVNGNFAFSRGQWNVEVPQDPDHYYWGEEFSVTVRSFTWGYDLFLPDEVVAWHMMHRGGSPRRHWEHGEDVVRRRNEVAFERLRRLIYSDQGHSLGPYGLGRVRSLRDYEIYAGFDLENKRAHPDVYTGANPDPVTIRSDADWARCITFARAMESGLVLTA